MTEMTLSEAKNTVRIYGTPCSEVLPQLTVRDAVKFREWFTRNSRVPNLVAREAQRPVFSGRSCQECGGMLVRTGSCEKCQQCSYEEGCG